MMRTHRAMWISYSMTDNMNVRHKNFLFCGEWYDVRIIEIFYSIAVDFVMWIFHSIAAEVNIWICVIRISYSMVVDAYDYVIWISSCSWSKRVMRILYSMASNVDMHITWNSYSVTVDYIIKFSERRNIFELD